MRDSQIKFIRSLGIDGAQFPDTLYSALMFQPRMVGIAVALGVLLQSPWLFVALSAALWCGTVFPSLNPFDAVYNQLVARRRGLPPLAVAPAPRRFAQGMAGSVAMVIGVALFTQTAIVAWIFQGLFVVASMGVAFRDSCAGADVYHLLKRLPRSRSASSRS